MTASMVKVILEDEDGNLCTTRLSKTNVKVQKNDHKPADKFELALMTVPKLEKKLKSVILEMSKIAQFHENEPAVHTHWPWRRPVEVCMAGPGSLMKLLRMTSSTRFGGSAKVV